MESLATISRPDPMDKVLAAVSDRYTFQARKFIGFLRQENLGLGDPQAWRLYLDSLEDLSAASYNAYLAAAKACIREALKA